MRVDHEQAAQQWDGTYSRTLIKLAEAAIIKPTAEERQVLSEHRFELGAVFQRRLDGIPERYKAARADHRTFRRLSRMRALSHELVGLQTAVGRWEQEVGRWWARKHPGDIQVEVHE